MRYVYLGKRLKFSVFLIPILYLWYFFAGAETLLSAVVAVALHEAGHMTAGKIMQKKISSVTLSALGADIEYTGTASYKADMLAALSGPVFSIAAGIAFCRIFPVFSAVSLIYGLLNLIPVPCFDGGRALRCIVYRCDDVLKADMICDTVSVVFLIIMYLFSVFLLFYTSFNASLLFLCAYIFIHSYIKMK